MVEVKIINWWNRLSYLKKGMYIGGLIGLLKIPFFMIFGESLSESIFRFAEIPDRQICNFLNFADGEPCGFFVFYYGWIYNTIFYAIIGILTGFVIQYFKNEKKSKILPKE